MPSPNENKTPNRMPPEARTAIKAVRALVSSLKETSTVLSVMRDYRAMEGEPLPFRKFGFNTVEDFLRASGEFVIKQAPGDATRIYIKPNSDSAHILQMVSAQKTSGSAGGGRGGAKRFVALRQPTAPSLSGRGFGGGATQYSRIYQHLPYSGRNNGNSSVSPKKISFKLNPPATTTAASAKTTNRPILKAQQTNGSTAAGGGKETNNNNKTTKNLNGQQQPQQAKLPSTDLRHVLNERNGNGQQQQAKLPSTDLRHVLNERNSILSRSSVEMRQPSKALPLSITISNNVARKLPFSVSDKTPAAKQQQVKQKVVQQYHQNQQQQQQQQPARKILPLMTIDVKPPETLGAATPSSSFSSTPAKSVNSRLMLAKAAMPSATAQEQTPQTSNPPSNNNFQRAQSLDERAPTTPSNHVPTAVRNVPQQHMMTTPYSPFGIVPLPASLPGKKSLQDRLKANQQLDEKDQARLPLPQQQQEVQPQPPNPFERTVSIPDTNIAPSLSLSEQINAFAPTTKPTTFSWNDPNATPVELLVKYSCYKGYDRPEYRYYRQKNGRIQCKVTLNGSSYTTYPADYGNQFEGQFAAALIAIEAIQRDESRQTYSVCLDSDPDIATTIYELLVPCRSGMFSKNIPDAFLAAHHELLPDHWFSIIDRYSNQLFQLEETSADTIVLARPQPSGSDVESNTSEARQMAMNQLPLPWNEQYWNLYITNPVSTVEVWARLVGPEYSDKMDALITDIEMSMLNCQPKAEELVAAVGEYYLVVITDCWYRVRVDEINYEANQCQCFFIDIGEREQLALDALYPCDPKYLQLPGQAKCFSLDGLEDFSEYPKGKHHLQDLLAGRVFIAQVLTKREDYEAAEQSDGPGTCTLKLMLYDTSTQNDVLLNPIILTRICDDTPTPELNLKVVNYVTISYVDDQGDVYCQKAGNMKYIQKLITNLTQSNALEGEYRGLYTSTADTTLLHQRLYLVQDETDGKWYRAALDAKESGPYCRMLYVDVGCRRRANVSNIYRLEMISLALNRYPAQAIRMRMFELPDCSEPQVLARLRAFLRPAMPAMAKVFGMETGILPLVKLYVHVADGGDEGKKILVCVNEAIKIEQELEINSELINSPRVAEGSIPSSSSDTDTTVGTVHSQSSAGYTLSSADGKDLSNRFDGLNLSQPLSSSPEISAKKSSSTPTASTTTTPNGERKEAIAKLAKVTLPAVGKLFDVKVTIASSPKFFIIQPYAQAKQLDQLMQELQKFCMTKAQPVRKDQVRQGEAYAALNRDGHWYRVTVVNIILFGPTPIHAYFCDFGLVAMLDVANLRVLPAKFRVLPQQAVKAKLYGVKPINKDWVTADAVRFQELTAERKFASVVRKVEEDEFNRHEELVELELIDVSTDDDILIHKVLVDEGRAIYTAEAHTV
ncbi:hypothetical protein ZHAS_00019439 [Anopheles sinensis]|uniref:Tudor domain-containing protein 7 n=1 Tax=Anopheles sinensis TaxID=74873 RepID=A0A084WLT5_ANOSI|nr:hypothetical protein ZHAS_00019439 [Anopheles sinensis]